MVQIEITYERSPDGELERIYAGASIRVVKCAKLSQVLLAHHSLEGSQFSAWHVRKEVAQAQDQLADRLVVYISDHVYLEGCIWGLLVAGLAWGHD